MGYNVARELKNVACFLLLLLAAFLAWWQPASAGELELHPSRQTVRVGFYQMNGYHMVAESGWRSGYGYDYLHLINRFTDWRYEYVGYDKGWRNMFDMLDRGEIDLLTAVQKTPDRATKYIFSNKPVTYSSFILTTRDDNQTYQPGNPATYEGMRVGLLMGNKRTDEFLKFAAEQGFSYTPVYFQTIIQEVEALKNGSVDAIATSNKRVLDHEKILEMRNPLPLYALTTPDKAELIRQLNKAQDSLSTLDPGWEVALSNRYYADVTSRMMALSAESQEFLHELRVSGKVFKVAMMPDANPYSYFDQDGQARGILPEIFQIIAQNAGIRYEILPAANQNEYDDLLRNGNVDIILGMSSSFYEAERVDCKITQSLLRVPIVELSRKNESAGGSEGPVGMTANLKRKLTKTGKMPVNVDPHNYDTPEDAIAALKAGECSHVYMLGIVGQKYVNRDKRNKLRIAIVPDTYVDFRLGIRGSFDHRFFEIMSAAIPPQGDPDVQKIVYTYTDVQPRETTWEELVYSNPIQFILLAILMALLASAVLIIIVRGNAARQDEKRRREIDAVMSYVCRLNEMVVKVDLRTHTATEYHIDQDGHVFVDVLPHTIERYTNYLFAEDKEKFQIGGQYWNEMHEAFEQHRIYYCEVLKQTDDGEGRFFSCRFQPFFQNGELAGFYFYRQDIDDERRNDIRQREALTDALENARHASEAKGDFLSRMSHEIRTPLNAIIGYLTLGAQKNNTEADLRQLIGKSQIAAHHLLGLINEILDLSSIEQGKLQIAREEFNLKDLMAEIQTIFNGQLTQKNIHLIINEEGVQHVNLKGDPMRIKQVLMNIFSNAVKFTPEEGSINFVIKQVLRPNNVFITTFEITDSGIGMSKEYLDNIFKPFEQESAKVAQKYGGSGLGLAISQNLVKMMHGSIEVRSVKGKGTSFFISLPLQGVKAQSEETEEKPADEISFVGMRLLLVEDNEMNREISETILEQHGFVIDTAVDGQDAVDKFTAAEAGTYKAILMDVQMPVLDGYGATKAIRRSAHPEAGTIPIIAVTADVFTDDVARVMACGMNDYLSKPIDFDKLLEKLRKFA